MRIFPKFRFEGDQNLNPQNILAGLLLAVKGQGASDVELMHVSCALAGPSTSHYLVQASELKDLVHSSERILETLGLDAFIREATAILSERQRLATLLTIMDVCLVENASLEGERAIFDRIREGFGIGEDELRPFEEMLTLKNDSSIRLNVLPSSYNRAAEGFEALV